jgi:hypothetical protein
VGRAAGTQPAFWKDTAMARRIMQAAAASAVGLIVALSAPASPATADVVDPAGACIGTAVWKSNGLTVNSAALKPGSVTTIPRADDVNWTGTVVGVPAGTTRPIAGSVGLELPWPLGPVTIGSWDTKTGTVLKAGTKSYSIPSLVPAGVEFDFVGHHDESGKRHCSGTAALKIAGGAFDSPLIWVALAGLLLFGVPLFLLGRGSPSSGARVGRAIIGVAIGLMFGLFLAVALVLFGILPLAGPWVFGLSMLGLIGGGVWSWFGPIGGGGTAPTSTPA